VTTEPPRCPACGADLPANARFCPQCGERLTAEGNAPHTVAPEKELHNCVICGRAVDPENSFRCPLCGREKVCIDHMVYGRTWASGPQKVKIPTCCEVCYGEEYIRNHALIDAAKKERKCGICGLLDAEFRCSACGRHFCARHAQERMIHALGQAPKRSYAVLSCSRCGNVCTECAGLTRPGLKKCRKCNGLISEGPGDKFHEELARCISKGYLTGYARRGYDAKGMPR
jgi:hypothetical protein